MLRNLAVFSLTTLVMVLMSQPASAALQASATFTSHQLAPNDFQCTLTLNNTGTTPIGTYWFSWFPGYDLLPHVPSNIQSPTGWTGLPLHEGIGVDSIEWNNLASPLAPGHSATGFVFDSPDSPAALASPSILGFPANTSFVYIGAAETDPGFQFATTLAVPEPASMTLLAAPLALLLRRRRK